MASSWEGEFLEESPAAPLLRNWVPSGTTGDPSSSTSPSSSLPLRSLSLDAHVLDFHLVEQLKRDLDRATSLLSARRVLELQPEIRLLLELSLLSFTVGLNKATPGMAMLSLKHESASRKKRTTNEMGLTPLQRVALCTVGPVGRWASERFLSFARTNHLAETEDGWKALAWRGFCLATLSSSLANTLNLCLFFRHGRYSTVTERLVGVTKTYDDPLINSSNVLGLLDDQLFWAKLYEFVSDMTPFASARLHQTKNFLKQFSYKAKRFAANQLEAWGIREGGEGKGKGKGKGGGRDTDSGHSSFASGGKHVCGICGRDPIVSISFIEPCKHPYCYYCLALHFDTFKEFNCKVCGQKAEGMSR